MIRIILDTDLSMGAPGTDPDDGFALALAHWAPNVDLELITTVGGNTDVANATRLTRELCSTLGIQNVPIVRGAATSYTHPERVSTDDEGASSNPETAFAAVEMVRLVMANPGQITVVAIGPLTNIATALVLEPAFASAVREFVIMGGTFAGATGQGARMAGEFNVWSDPEAAAAVLRSGAPQRWVGLDVTRQVRLTRDDAERLIREAPGPFGRLAGESTRGWIDHLARSSPKLTRWNGSCAMHDPLAVAAVINPDLLTWQKARVDVVTGDGPARGVMVADLLFAKESPAPNCTIATEVNSHAVTTLLLDALAAL